MCTQVHWKLTSITAGWPICDAAAEAGVVVALWKLVLLVIVFARAETPHRLEPQTRASESKGIAAISDAVAGMSSETALPFVLSQWAIKKPKNERELHSFTRQFFQQLDSQVTTDALRQVIRLARIVAEISVWVLIVSSSPPTTALAISPLLDLAEELMSVISFPIANTRIAQREIVQSIKALRSLSTILLPLLTTRKIHAEHFDRLNQRVRELAAQTNHWKVDIPKGTLQILEVSRFK